MFTPRVLNRSATPCLRLEVFEVSNLRRCCTHGSTIFAPVVRGEDPDREAALRTASEHSANRGEDRPGQVHGVTRAEARPVVRVQRERVVPSLPAETAEDRAVDLGPVLFGAGRAEEGGPASARIPQAASHGLGPASRLGAGLAAQGWSPELIEGRLKAQCAGDPSMRISHECLYQWIYAKPQRALDLRQYLARGRKRRTRKKGRKAKGPRIPMRVPIADRPEAVGSRKGFGHFESDTVVGAAPSRRCVNTQVERRSRRLFARLCVLSSCYRPVWREFSFRKSGRF